MTLEEEGGEGEREGGRGGERKEEGRESNEQYMPIDTHIHMIDNTH